MVLLHTYEVNSTWHRKKLSARRAGLDLLVALLAEDVAVAALEDVAAGDAHAHRTLEVLPHILHQAIHRGLRF